MPIVWPYIGNDDIDYKGHFLSFAIINAVLIMYFNGNNSEVGLPIIILKFVVH